jgi:hypothetical protein
MKMSYETRVKQRLTISKVGGWLIKLALLLGILGFVFTTFNVTRFGLTLAGFAAVTAPFGAVLTIVFSKIGWSENLLIDVLFNQTSILVVTMGFLAILFFIGFSTIYNKNHPFLLIIGILSLASSMVLMALGSRFSTHNSKVF